MVQNFTFFADRILHQRKFPAIQYILCSREGSSIKVSDVVIKREGNNMAHALPPLYSTSACNTWYTMYTKWGCMTLYCVIDIIDYVNNSQGHSPREECFYVAYKGHVCIKAGSVSHMHYLLYQLEMYNKVCNTNFFVIAGLTYTHYIPQCLPRICHWDFMSRKFIHAIMHNNHYTNHYSL